MNCKHIENPDDGTKTEEQFMMSQPSEVCWQDRDSSGGQPLQQELFPYAVVSSSSTQPAALVASILLRPENQVKAFVISYSDVWELAERQRTTHFITFVPNLLHFTSVQAKVFGGSYLSYYGSCALLLSRLCFILMPIRSA